MSEPGLSPIAGTRFVPDLEPCPDCGREPTAGQNYCRTCRKLYRRAWRAASERARVRDRKWSNARNHAVARLVEKHRSEYEALLREETQKVASTSKDIGKSSVGRRDSFSPATSEEA